MIHRLHFGSDPIRKRVLEFLDECDDDLYAAIHEAFEEIKKHPRNEDVVKIKPPLKIFNGLAHYRYKGRSGKNGFRIFFDVDDGNKIVVLFGIRDRNERTYK